MPNPSIDRLETLECVERNGVIRKLVRLARVFGLSNTDYRQLWAALIKAGIPAYGSGLVDTSNAGTIAATQAFAALVLVERSAKIAEGDPATVDVTLTYEHVLDGPNQGVAFPGIPSKILYARSRSSIVQKPTNFFYPYGNELADTTPIPILGVSQFGGVGGGILINVPANFYVTNDLGVVIDGVTGTTEANGNWTITVVGPGQLLLNSSTFVNNWTGGGEIGVAPGTLAPRLQILTGHKYPLDDRDWKGQIQIQGGEINLPFPQENLRLDGYTYTSNPDALKLAIHRKVNSDNWRGRPPRTWLCTEVQYEVLSPRPVSVPLGVVPNTPLYRFEFEIQYDSDGWDQTVAFKDQRTGLPPSTVQIGTIPDPATPTVLNQQLDPTTNQPFPAGTWTVPALPQTNFLAFFQANFDGT